MNFINTPFNYTGSKFKLLEQIIPILDYNKSNFIDVFCGGGAIYTNCIDKYDTILANDIISDLIEIHKNIINDRDDFINKVKHIVPNIDEHEKYLNLRKSYNSDKTPEKLFALMLSCTNNMMRFNKSFLFNQTFGKRSFNKNTELKIDNFVNHVVGYKDKLSFSSLSFEKLDILPNTMYYIDPGYDITDCKGFIDIEEMYRDDAFEKLNSDIAYVYYKVKQNTKLPIYRFEYMYMDFEDKANIGNIDIIFSEGDESNIKKMVDVKKKYGDFFLFFNEIAIF